MDESVNVRMRVCVYKRPRCDRRADTAIYIYVNSRRREEEARRLSRACGFSFFFTTRAMLGSFRGSCVEAENSFRLEIRSRTCRVSAFGK